MLAATVSTDCVLFRSEFGVHLEHSDKSPKHWNGDALVIFARACKDGQVLLGEDGEAVDLALGGALKALVRQEDFKAKEGSAKSFHMFNAGAAQRVVVVGLGSAEKADWRLAGAVAAGQLRDMRGGSAGFACVRDAPTQELAEGVLLGLHTDRRFKGSKTDDKDVSANGPHTVEFLGDGRAGDATCIDRAKAIASGVNFTRELVNGPANYVTPLSLADAAVDLAARTKLSATILDEAQCEAMGMGSFLAVARGSDVPARLIHLKYTPKGGSPSKRIAVVGKGITFDSGGYNLKAGPGSMIESMKFDMGGAATTLGAAAAIAQLEPDNVEVHFIVPTCENMINGKAFRPGDIITAMDGTTIEVNNTDAEGRLILADALLYCQDQGVSEVVDVATLTGACMVALGQNITGLWSNSDTLAQELQTASKTANEKLWRMPLEESYFEGLKSDLADMKNTGPRFGGAITAALFLQKFVKEGTSWAHLDIAGPVWAEKASGLNREAGGTGCMVRTLVEYAERSR